MDFKSLVNVFIVVLETLSIELQLITVSTRNEVQKAFELF